MSTPLETGPLSALCEIVGFLASLKEPEEDRVWARVVDKLAVALDCEAATYYSYLASKRQLLPRHAIGPRADDLKGTPVDIRTGLSGWVATRREPLLVDDAYQDERFLREVDEVTGFRTKSVLGVPLVDRLDLSGVIQLLNKRAGPFTPEDLRFVSAACEAAMLAVRAAKLEDMVDKVAARNQSILESLGGGFMAIDTHGRLILCNPAAKRILGLPPDLPLNIPAEQALLHAPKLADAMLDTLATRKTARRQELVWEHRGRSATLGYSTILIQDPQGEITGAGITFQDITGFKK